MYLMTAVNKLFSQTRFIRKTLGPKRHTDSLQVPNAKPGLEILWQIGCTPFNCNYQQVS